MNFPQFSPEEWLQIGRAVFLVFSFILAAVTFAAWRRTAIRQNEQSLAHGAEVLRRLDGLDAGLAALTTLSGQITETLERTTRADGAGARALSGYPIAIRLARSGASAPELVSTCGISHSEADLVCRLHGAAREPGSTAA
jgi:hypothetical protein